jgi:hypothetical protein
VIEPKILFALTGQRNPTTEGNMSASSASSAEGGSGVIDLEEYAKADRKVPPHRPGVSYRIRIDKVQKVVDVPELTGAQILGLVGKTPDRFRLDQKVRGGATRKIEPTAVVSFTAPGVERFMTLPLDQTEGERSQAGRSS